MEIPNLMKPKPTRLGRPSSKMQIGWKTKTFAVVGTILIGLGLFYQGLISVNNFFDTHYFQFNSPVVVDFSPPVELRERVAPEIRIVEIIKELDLPDGPETDIEDYICDLWGIYECNVAIAVAKAEGLAYDEDGELIPDLWNANNNSIDIGVFQINSVHFSKPECQFADMLDPYKNVDCARSLYEASDGWGPWVAFTNGTFRRHLK